MQNKNKPESVPVDHARLRGRKHWVAAATCIWLAAAQPATAAEADAASGVLTEEAAKQLKSSVPTSPQSVAQGRKLFMSNCTQCHGTDGKAQLDVVANATNLTDPPVYLHGTSDGEIYRSIRDGAGVAMPPFKTVIKADEDLWNLVNFIRTLWPATKQKQ